MSFPFRGLVIIRLDAPLETMDLQVALVGESIQRWARSSVLHVSSEVVVLRLSIAQRLFVTFAPREEAFDQIN